jgi:S1-C subfamily serine protease
VARVVPQLIAHGRVARPGLGVFLASPGIAGRLGAKGAVIREVQPGSPAAVAGLVGLRVERTGRPRLGDVITAVDGAPVNDVNDLLRALDARAVGDAVTLAIARDGAAREVRVTLAAID